MICKHYLLALCIMSAFLISSSLELYVSNPSTTLIQSNLDEDNWIYGGMTPTEYKKAVFEEITKVDNIVKCNSFFPYFNGKNCIQCPEDAKYFNLKEKKCVDCSNGIKDHECS